MWGVVGCILVARGVVAVMRLNQLLCALSPRVCTVWCRRMVSGANREFTYDGFGQPSTITQGNFSSSLLYSATGLLINRTDVDPTGTMTVLLLGNFEQVLKAGVPIICRAHLHGGAVVLTNGCDGQPPTATYISR